MPLDEGEGSAAADGSGNGYTGAVSGAIWTRGTICEGLSFDGVDDSVELGDILNTLSLPVSICAWVRRSSGASGHSTIIATEAHPSLYYGLWLNVREPGGEVQINYGDGRGAGASARRTFTASAGVPADTWSHVCAVVEGPTAMAIYLDGAPSTGTFSGSGGAMRSTSTSLRVGVRRPGLNWHTGHLDELRIYSRALSPAEVTSLASTTL